MDIKILAYIIRNGGNASIEISQSRFEEIKRSKSYDDVLHSIDGKLSLVVENYLDWETECVRKGILDSIRRLVESNEQNLFHDIQLKLISYLTSLSMFMNQIKKDWGRLGYSEDFVHEKFIRLKDENLLFKFVWELRNVVQHNVIPLKTMYSSSGFVRVENETYHLNTFTPTVNLQWLRENDSEFKLETYSSLADEKGDVDLLVALENSFQAAISHYRLLRNEIKEEHESHLKNIISLVDDFRNIEGFTLQHYIYFQIGEHSDHSIVILPSDFFESTSPFQLSKHNTPIVSFGSPDIKPIAGSFVSNRRFR